MSDNIIAISTLVGESAINIIRLSGPNVIEIVSNFFTKDLTKVEANTINYGYFKYNNEIIDEVLISVFRAPKSYTTEDLIEINTHGGISTVKKIMEILLQEDVRIAEPGEFIKRAFLNGRIDLLEAEAVNDVITSSSESARKLSIKGLNGEVTRLIENLRKDIMKILGNIEVNIDYPEYDDIEIMTIDLLKTKIEDIKEKFQKLYNESKKSDIIKNGINVSIVGRPNVGKSSLLNKLIKEDKAIVTDIPGTTRDIVEGKVNIDGITLNLIDTAGIRETNNVVEEIGVNKSFEILNNTDLVLLVLSNENELNEAERKIINESKDKKLIIVINKCDLATKCDINENNVVKISVKENNGIEELINKIKEEFNINSIIDSDFTYLSNSRQISLLKKCLDIIENIEKSLETQTPIDIIEIDIKLLWETLGEIIGKTYDNELLDEIFSNFCLGK